MHTPAEILQRICFELSFGEARFFRLLVEELCPYGWGVYFDCPEVLEFYRKRTPGTK
jgi:hypothetical protein